MNILVMLAARAFVALAEMSLYALLDLVNYTIWLTRMCIRHGPDWWADFTATAAEAYDCLYELWIRLISWFSRRE